MQPNLTELENRLWDAADELRANSGLKASEYASPVLGLDLPALRRGSVRGGPRAIEAKATSRRKIGPRDYHAEG